MKTMCVFKLKVMRKDTYNQAQASTSLHSAEAVEVSAESDSIAALRLGPGEGTETECEVSIEEISGRSKRKRVPRNIADALNGCLCGQVLDRLTDGVLKCNQAGCETQWVS